MKNPHEGPRSLDQVPTVGFWMLGLGFVDSFSDGYNPMLRKAGTREPPKSRGPKAASPEPKMHLHQVGTLKTDP